MRSKKRAIIIGLVFIVIAAIATYTAVIPAIVSHRYILTVGGTVRSLQSDFKALDKSIDLPLMANSSATSLTKQNNGAYITQLITDTRQKLVLVKKENDSLEPMPFSNIFGQYNKALILHSHIQRFLGQTEDALDEYLTLTIYLETYNRAVDDVTSRLNDFNNVSDLNEYAGRSEAVRQIANAIRADAAILVKASHPSDVADMHDATIKAFNAAADGFDQLADGLAIPADDPIYQAARSIEGAATQLEEVTSTDYDGGLDKSRAIKNIQDFSEKLDSVLET